MKALTIKAPWAQAIVHGTKRIENRTWKPHADVIGQRIAIHCAKGLAVAKHYSNPSAKAQLLRANQERIPAETYPVPNLGSIIGTARVAGFYDDAGRYGELFDEPMTLMMMTSGEEFPAARIEADEWWLGPIGWLLDDVRAVEPVSARGQVGLWTVPDNIELVEVKK